MPLSFSYPTENTPDIYWSVLHTRTHARTHARMHARTHAHTHTLRASLSGTFLQTLPDLLRPLKGHSLSPRSCPATRSAPSERFRYYDCRSNLAPKKHVSTRRIHPGSKTKKKFRLDSNECGFICAGANFAGGYK